MKRAMILIATAAMWAGMASAAPAPKPLYRDPVYDGAADVSSVYDRTRHQWTMFYTDRRANLKSNDPKDVAWVHGTPIGMATSKDGVAWRYAGLAQFPAECTGATLWAPELYQEHGVYHMWLTVVPGIFHSWGAPGATAKIVHLTSPDLKSWTCGDTLDVGSSRVIDPSLLKLPDGTYRLWYKDERQGSHIFWVDSPDMVHWGKPSPAPVVATHGEGPKAFVFQGAYWIIYDSWNGLSVLRSDDGKTWTPQAQRILEAPGKTPTDTDIGHHPDIIVNNGRAFIYYFVHQGNEPQAKAEPAWQHRTVIQVAELKLVDGQLTADRDASVDATLIEPKE